MKPGPRPSEMFLPFFSKLSDPKTETFSSSSSTLNFFCPNPVVMRTRFFTNSKKCGFGFCPRDRYFFGAEAEIFRRKFYNLFFEMKFFLSRPFPRFIVVLRDYVALTLPLSLTFSLSLSLSLICSLKDKDTLQQTDEQTHTHAHYNLLSLSYCFSPFSLFLTY